MPSQSSQSPRVSSAGSAELGAPGAQRRTVISRRRINPSKLEQLLDTRFEDYSVELQQDRLVVIATRRLSDIEINKCA
ncbi:hypothetical protein INS49_006866 [Diaporthe citri]|uniref:uncharacterized protein n=1 Tax=Diaporthe citri TaxID=83186 RepID=UPI001C8044B5|nr:uncharacterized protein INS49_006866 [Diaporthe citri]KAG6365257.1 hypothetical protein INS49_006866 [Diaporthe citri]